MPYIQSVTHTIKQYNEDAHGHSKNMAWVMDGALPLNKAHFTDGPSDVVWFVDWWKSYLNDHLERHDFDTIDLMEQGVLSLNKAYAQFAEIETLSKLDRASASIGFVRRKSETLECFVLGDVEIVLQMRDGSFKTVTDTSIASMDQEVIDMIAHRSENVCKVVFNGYTADELEILRRNRMRMNAEDGYAILEHEVSAIRKGIFDTFEANEVKSVLLMSDGFSALYNKYDCHRLDSLIDAVESQGLDKLIEQLRAHEEHGFKTCRRLRKHDDATAVFMRF